MDTTVKPQDTNGSVTASPSATGGLQPFLHDAVVTLHAPSLVISRADGQLSAGADGFYHGDRRALSRLTVTAEGVETAAQAQYLMNLDCDSLQGFLFSGPEAEPALPSAIARSAGAFAALRGDRVAGRR